MHKVHLRSGTAIAAIAALTMIGSATADAGVIYSGDGQTVLVASVDPGVITEITPHPAWGDVDGAGPAVWISYTATGFGAGNVTAPNISGSRVPSNATAIFSRGFSSSGGGFQFSILGDDTVGVELNRDGGGTTTLFDPFAGQIDPCAPGDSGGVVGCTPGSVGTAFLDLEPGDYTVVIYAYQTNGSTFGVNFSGTYDMVPEPLTIGLLGTGLLGLGLALRRRKGA